MAAQKQLKPLAKHPFWVAVHPKSDQCFSICFCSQITFPSKSFRGQRDSFTMHWILTTAHYFPLQQPLRNRTYIFTLPIHWKPLVWDGMTTFQMPVERWVHNILTVQVRLSQKQFNIKPPLQLSAWSVILSSSSRIWLLSQDVAEMRMKIKSTHQDWETVSRPDTGYRIFCWRRQHS